ASGVGAGDNSRASGDTGAGGAEAMRVEDTVRQAGRRRSVVVQLDVLHLDVDGAERDRARGVAVERGNDLDVVEGAGSGMAGGRVDRKPVGTGEGGGVGVALQLALQRLDLDVDLFLVGSAGAVGGDELDLDVVDRVDRLLHAGVGGIDLGGAEAERILDGGKSLVVRAHR